MASPGRHHCDSEFDVEEEGSEWRRAEHAATILPAFVAAESRKGSAANVRCCCCILLRWEKAAVSDRERCRRCRQLVCNVRGGLASAYAASAYAAS